MILEAVYLYVKPGLEDQFEKDFQKASPYVTSMIGYIDHSLHQCMEDSSKYLLMIKWQRLEDHTIGFRQSDEYKEWKKLLHHYYDPFPVVEHFSRVV